MPQNNKLQLHLGDITELDVDAIVNAANNYLRMGGGVAGAIKRKGGIEIEKEAVSFAPIPIGEAVVTGAGKLKSKYVIHAAVMNLDFKTDEEKIKRATESALRRADELKIRTVAFPALGTGVGGFPIEKCAEIMLSATKEHLKKKTCLESVVFALFSKESYEKFETVLRNMVV